jgi:hypothetical protein
MFSNPITGRKFLSSRYPPNETEAADLDSGLIIAVCIFCILGPFWLLYRLVEYLIKKVISFVSRIRGANDLLPENKTLE